MRSGDEELRERFLALRREEEAGMPAFSVATRPARGKRGRRGGFLLAGCIASSLAAVLWWQRPVFERPRHEPAGPTVSITEWKAPTAFLLETPGSELLRTVPAIGGDMGLTNGLLPEERFPKHVQKVLP